MKKLLGIFLLIACAPFAEASDYESSLLVQTGTLRESDLIVRTVTDLEDSRICLAFYVRTTGTSPSLACYDALPGFRSKLRQIGHFKEGDLVVRKIHDSVNLVSCVVTYVSTESTSPVIHCYQSDTANKDSLIRKTQLRQGDLHVHQLVDPGSNDTCLVAYVATQNTAPALSCYQPRQTSSGGGLDQTGVLKEGDLIVRKISDLANDVRCFVTYVSTPGTSPHIYCPEKDGLRSVSSPAAPATATTTADNRDARVFLPPQAPTFRNDNP